MSILPPLSKAKASTVRALHRRKGRREHGAFLAEGDRALDELVGGGASIRFAFAREESAARLVSLVGAERAYVVDARSASLFATDSPQGIAAVVETPAPRTLGDVAAGDGPLIVLDGVADPGNVGTIVRSAEWFGIEAVVMLPGCADPYNPKSVRSSMGSLLRVALVDADARELVAAGREIFSLDAHGAASLDRSSLTRRALYVIGSEARGISPAIAAVSSAIAIPGRGGVESLNAAVAASILCYELSRIDE